jgi:DNA-binding NarL/FixJ family response regulator/class 3 adenylate cyclase
MVTVLFTDMVGSTAMMASRGDAAGDALLEAHDALVRATVGEHGGREVKSTGDGFQVAFGSVRDGLVCAGAIQRAVTEHNAQDPDLAFDVRIGINAGDVAHRDEDMFGTVVNAAARITSKAKAGEVLVGEAVRRLAAGSPDLVFIDRGRFALKGLPEKWRLFELDWSGTSSARRPVRKATKAQAPAPATPVTRVLIVDDEALVRTGFHLILDAQPDIQVVAEASDGAEVMDLLHRSSVDVVLMDIQMKTMSGLEATRLVLTGLPDPPRVIVLTTFDYDEYVYEALRAGASAFLLKDTPPEQLVDAVRVVAGGDALLHPAITRRLIADFIKRGAPAPSAGDDFKELTARELEVLKLLARGMSNAEIAAQLFLGETTIKSHVGSILMKLGLRDRVQAVVRAYESGLVRAGD